MKLKQSAIDNVKGLSEYLKKKSEGNAAEERTWFQKGAFADGYQLGDVTKTVLGTSEDLRENMVAGILGIGESALDAMAWLGNAYAKGQYYANGGGYNIQADQAFEQAHKASTDATAEFIKKDLYDEKAIADEGDDGVIVACALKSLCRVLAVDRSDCNLICMGLLVRHNEIVGYRDRYAVFFVDGSTQTEKRLSDRV